MSWFDQLKTPRIKTSDSQRVSKVPEGLWVKCPACAEILQAKVLGQNLQVCPDCGHHFRMSSAERIVSLVDVDSFVEFGEALESKDPLQFQDRKSYQDRLRQTARSLGIRDAFVAGQATLRGRPYVLGVFEFRFMGGSMGVVVGEKIRQVFAHALAHRIPAVIVSASGGARMQEGILSLMQMAKTTAILQELKREGIPFISVLTDPTTGGVAASFSMLGDVILAEPNALIGFAGPRVIEQTIRQALPQGFQRSEFLLKHGFVDRIVPRSEMSEELYFWMTRLGARTCWKESSAGTVAGTRGKANRAGGVASKAGTKSAGRNKSAVVRKKGTKR